MGEVLKAFLMVWMSVRRSKGVILFMGEPRLGGKGVNCFNYTMCEKWFVIEEGFVHREHRKHRRTQKKYLCPSVFPSLIVANDTELSNPTPTTQSNSANCSGRRL